jgi:hypothetical protein
MDNQGIPCLEEVSSHRAAHDPETNKSNALRHCPSAERKRSLKATIYACAQLAQSSKTGQGEFPLFSFHKALEFFQLVENPEENPDHLPLCVGQ